MTGPPPSAPGSPGASAASAGSAASAAGPPNASPPSPPSPPSSPTSPPSPGASASASASRPPVERRRPGWREFRRAYPGLITAFWLALTAMVLVDGWLAYKRVEYADEVARLRRAMTAVERHRADVVFAANKTKVQVIVELARRQAEGDRDLHLSVAVDSGKMFLEREGALLRSMPVRVGAERVVGRPPDTVRVAAPRGMRTVAAVSEWSVTLDGGTTIYAKPASDGLGDSLDVTPGNVRARASDLQAILPNLRPGVSVYFY